MKFVFWLLDNHEHYIALPSSFLGLFSLSATACPALQVQVEGAAAVSGHYTLADASWAEAGPKQLQRPFSTR